MLKKNFKNTNFHELIFLEEELVEFCKDSSGRKDFSNEINNQKKFFNKYKGDESKEYIILFNILKDRIKLVQSISNEQKKSKAFILNVLNQFHINFPINDLLVLNLLDYDKRDLATLEECDVSISNFVIFLYNPELYVKVLSENKLKDYSVNRRAHFIGCVFENYNYPKEFRIKMKEGTLKLIKDSKNPSIGKIYNEILKCNLDKEAE